MAYIRNTRKIWSLGNGPSCFSAIPENYFRTPTELDAQYNALQTAYAVLSGLVGPELAVEISAAVCYTHVRMSREEPEHVTAKPHRDIEKMGSQ